MADKLHELCAWMNGERVGTWRRGRTGAHRFTYEASWLESPRVRPLSVSMPITSDRTVTGALVEHYFDNLLPDDERIRRRVATRFKTGSTETFELLQAIGRDCVGAVPLLPPDTAPDGFDRVDGEPMSDADIERHLQGVVAEPGFGAHEGVNDFRISIAGAQEKSALLHVNGQWCRPLGATPTTHILKLPLGRVGGRRLELTHSVHNEWLCAQFLKGLGLPVASTEVARFGDQLVLVVEHFDRHWSTRTRGGRRWKARLPQEDFCQVMGLPSRLKYEAAGGPGMRPIMQVLLGSQAAPADVTTFLCAQLAFWLLAATDGHAKSFSIFLLPGGRYRMTPLYDVISLWPVIGKGPNHVPWPSAKLAMAIRSKSANYVLQSILARHWQGVAQRSGVPGVWDAMVRMAERVEPALVALQASLPADFPERTAWAVFTGVRSQLKRLTAG